MYAFELKMYLWNEEVKEKRHYLSIQQRTASTQHTQYTTKYAEEAAKATKTTPTTLYNGGNR